jgi:hypothetical protein
MQLNDVPKRVARDSAASRNSVVAMALSFAESTGTSTNDLLTVVSHGAILQSREGVAWFQKRESLQEENRGQSRGIDNNRGGAEAVSGVGGTLATSNGGACT